MATNVRAPNPIQIAQVERFQSDFLSEVVELSFGMITLCWIVTSLCTLI